MSDTNWKPQFALDLRTAKPKDFETTKIEFERWRKTNPPEGPLPWSTGWVTVTPPIAEQMLRYNPIQANRPPAFSQVKYYAAQMERGDWQRTGQPVIFVDDGAAGRMGDGGHRVWAGYLSQSTFDTFVVTGIEDKPRLFAYFDNGKVRSAADALVTGGKNGLASLMTTTLQIAEGYEVGAYTPAGKKSGVPRMSPAQLLDYADNHPNIHTAANLVSGEYSDTVQHVLSGHKPVACFVAMKIMDHYGEAVLEDFFDGLGQVDTWPDDSPLAQMQAVMARDRAVKPPQKPMKRNMVLGYLIKAFNLFATGTTVKKLKLTVDEAFPIFHVPTASAPSIAGEPEDVDTDADVVDADADAVETEPAE